MDLPVPTLGPPPLPAEAVPIILRFFNRRSAEMLWEGCWWSGFSSGILVMLVVQGVFFASILIALIQLLRSRRI